mmetsp:Transcript_26420/g.85377  ORF Transcript_26420/g.85377 Transcript_26420/m.85377 type:complete len:267 (+) Transcript_26420:296-1096(+)
MAPSARTTVLGTLSSSGSRKGSSCCRSGCPAGSGVLLTTEEAEEEDARVEEGAEDTDLKCREQARTEDTNASHSSRESSCNTTSPRLSKSIRAEHSPKGYLAAPGCISGETWNTAPKGICSRTLPLTLSDKVRCVSSLSNIAMQSCVPTSTPETKTEHPLTSDRINSATAALARCLSRSTFVVVTRTKASKASPESAGSPPGSSESAASAAAAASLARGRAAAPRAADDREGRPGRGLRGGCGGAEGARSREQGLQDLHRGRRARV